MRLAAWVRDRLWRANNWCAELAQIRQALATERRSATTSERMFDVACATEYCDPDRSRALPLYLDAWRGGHAEAGGRAKQLAAALGAHMALGEIATVDGDPLAAGIAFLDAGFPALAVEPLQKFIETRPAGASPVTENVRVEGVTALLAIARGARFDADREIADSLARARIATCPAAAAAYLHAVRVARAAHLEDRLATILPAAMRACPDDDTIAALVAARLFETGNSHELLAHYTARLERATTRADYAERARAAGVELIARNLQPGLGLRLLRMSLEHAYTVLLPGVTAHLAAWELLWTHAQAQCAAVELMPLLVQALAAPLTGDDALYLARLALEITWRHGSDPVAARPYAAMVIDFVPDHPLAVEFVTEAAPDMFAEALPDEEPPAEPAPTAASGSGAPVKPTERFSLNEGQVKRSVAAPSTTAQAHRISGRMALLQPPAPAPPPAPLPIEPAKTQVAVTAHAPSKPPMAGTPPIAGKPPTEGRPIKGRPQSSVRQSGPFPVRAPRKVVPIDVVVELPAGGFFSTVLRDLSMSGAFIITKRQLDVGMIVSLEMQIPMPGKVTASSHRTSARIARSTDLGCGVAFIDATPELVAAIRAFIA